MKWENTETGDFTSSGAKHRLHCEHSEQLHVSFPTHSGGFFFALSSLVRVQTNNSCPVWIKSTKRTAFTFFVRLRFVFRDFLYPLLLCFAVQFYYFGAALFKCFGSFIDINENGDFIIGNLVGGQHSAALVFLVIQNANMEKSEYGIGMLGFRLIGDWCIHRVRLRLCMVGLCHCVNYGDGCYLPDMAVACYCIWTMKVCLRLLVCFHWRIENDVCSHEEGRHLGSDCVRCHDE